CGPAGDGPGRSGTVQFVARSGEGAGGLWICSANPGGRHHVLRASRQLGHPLRRSAPGLYGSDEFLGRVPDDRSRPPTGLLGGIYDHHGFALWVRGECGCASRQNGRPGGVNSCTRQTQVAPVLPRRKADNRASVFLGARRFVKEGSMTGTDSGNRVSGGRLILVPAYISLAVSL